MVRVNSVSDGKTPKLVQIEKKKLADDKSKIVQIIICFYARIEKIVEKGENAGHQHFLLFPRSFQ